MSYVTEESSSGEEAYNDGQPPYSEIIMEESETSLPSRIVAQANRRSVQNMRRPGSILGSKLMDSDDDATPEPQFGRRDSRRRASVLSTLTTRNTGVSDSNEKIEAVKKETEEDPKATKEKKPKKKAAPAQPVSLVFQRQGIFSYLSLSFGILLLGVCIYEYVSLINYEITPATMQYLASILVYNFIPDKKIVQVMSFYLFLLGFIYANESGDVKAFLFASAAGSTFVLPLTVQFVILFRSG